MTRWMCKPGPDVPLQLFGLPADFRMRDKPPTPPETLTPRADRPGNACTTFTRQRADETGQHDLRRLQKRLIAATL